MVRVGDVVGRKSYGCDILFRVKDLKEDNGIAVLRGLTARLEATAPISDLVIIKKDDQMRRAMEHNTIARQKMRLLNRGMALQREKVTRAKKGQPSISTGHILHLDGDPEYVLECQTFYNNLNVTARCLFVPESEQARRITALCNESRPDIIVITGHDGKEKHKGKADDISHYHNSQEFLEATESVRMIRPDKDGLAIVAGACQSYYELLIAGGANFASSPGRILIDIFDPCILAVQIAALGIRDYLQPESAVNATIGQAQGMGGIETKGKARVLYPAVTRKEDVPW